VLCHHSSNLSVKFFAKLHLIIQLFLLLGMQGLVLSPVQDTFATLLILTLRFMKGV